MYQGLLILHNLLRWVILILIVIAIAKSFLGIANRSKFTNGDQKTGLFLMIAAHITLLIGLYQWFAGPWGLKLIQNAGMAVVMKNAVYRFWAVEHITGMVIAILLITIGRGAGKKNITDMQKHRRTFWLYLVAFFIIMITIPWPKRVGVGRPLIPGMQQTVTVANSTN